MNQGRRFFLGTAGAAFGATLISKGTSPLAWGLSEAQAAEKSNKPATSDYSELIKTAADCQRTGELCAAHCQRELAKGNTSMAKCHAQVQQMLAMTKAVLSMAAQGAPLTGKMAALCAQACKSCGEACAEHKEHFAHGMHLECRDCMEACQACEKACQKVTA